MHMCKIHYVIMYGRFSYVAIFVIVSIMTVFLNSYQLHVYLGGYCAWSGLLLDLKAVL